MSGDTHREVRLERIEPGRFRAVSAGGATLDFGNGEADFSPIELMLAALGGCTAMDVEALTSRRAEPQSFVVVAAGEKIRTDGGNAMTDLSVILAATFPAGPEGDAARTVLPDALTRSHDRLCTVSRTIELGAPVSAQLAEGGDPSSA